MTSGNETHTFFLPEMFKQSKIQADFIDNTDGSEPQSPREL